MEPLGRKFGIICMCHIPGVVVAIVVVGALDVVVASMVVTSVVLVGSVLGFVVVVTIVLVVSSVVEEMSVVKVHKISVIVTRMHHSTCNDAIHLGVDNAHCV